MCKPDIRPRAKLLKNLHSESVKLLEAEAYRRFGNGDKSEKEHFERIQKICPHARRVPVDDQGRLKTFYPYAWRILGDVADSMSGFPDVSTTQVAFCVEVVDVPYANVLLLVHSLLDPESVFDRDVTEALEQFVNVRATAGGGAIFPSSESALGDMSEVLHDRWDEINQPEREVFYARGGYVKTNERRWWVPPGASYPMPRGFMPVGTEVRDMDTGEAFSVPAAKVTRHEDVAEIRVPYFRTGKGGVGNNFTLGRGKLSISRDGGKTFEELPYDVKSFSFTPLDEAGFANGEGEMVFTDGPDAGKPIGTTFPWPKHEERQMTLDEFKAPFANYLWIDDPESQRRREDNIKQIVTKLGVRRVSDIDPKHWVEALAMLDLAEEAFTNDDERERCPICGCTRDVCAFGSDPDLWDEDDAIDFNIDDDNFGGDEITHEEITPQQQVENALDEFEDRLVEIISKTYGIPESFLRAR